MTLRSATTSSFRLFLIVAFAGLTVVCCVPFVNAMLDGFARPLIDVVINLPDLQLVLLERPIGPDETEVISIKYGLIIRELLALLLIAVPLCLTARWILGRGNDPHNGR